MKPPLFVAALGFLLAVGVRADPSVADFKAQLLAADNAFCAMSVKDGAYKAFLGVVTPDAKVLSQRTGKGPAAVAAEFKDTPPTALLTWTPTEADASASGDLGYTWGRWEYKDKTPDGRPVDVKGTYVTIWKRQADGSWKVVLDGGNPDPPSQ
jgi:ketosteroid isomerase-like protein